MKKFTRTFGGLIIAFNIASCSNQADTPKSTLENACPQVKTTSTTIVESNFPTSTEDDLTLKITGELKHNDEGLLNAVALLLDKAGAAKKPNVHVYIASTGGEISQGFALRDTIKYYGEDKFVILCTTQASSAASYIFTSQAKRYALPSCMITTHAASGSIFEPEKIPREELKRIKAALESTTTRRTEQIRELYRRSLNLTPECATFLTRKDDTELSAYDALRLGFLDAVLEADGKMTIRSPKTDGPSPSKNISLQPR